MGFMMMGVSLFSIRDCVPFLIGGLDNYCILFFVCVCGVSRFLKKVVFDFETKRGD